MLLITAACSGLKPTLGYRLRRANRHRLCTLRRTLAYGVHITYLKWRSEYLNRFAANVCSTKGAAAAFDSLEY